jgi:hypothetical protein
MIPDEEQQFTRLGHGGDNYLDDKKEAEKAIETAPAYVEQTE